MKAENKGDVHVVQVCRGATINRYLLFEDGGFLFFKAKDKESYFKEYSRGVPIISPYCKHGS